MPEATPPLTVPSLDEATGAGLRRRHDATAGPEDQPRCPGGPAGRRPAGARPMRRSPDAVARVLRRYWRAAWTPSPAGPRPARRTSGARATAPPGPPAATHGPLPLAA